jgi:outer membrane protein assembly factor BamB
MDQSSSRKPLRLWPGVVFAIVLVLGRYVAPLVIPEEVEIFSLPLGLLALFGGMLAAVGIVIWWVFFSRARWSERLAAIVLMALAVVALKPLVHVSIRTGNMGFMLMFYSIPILSLAIVVWAVAARRFSDGMRRVSLVAAVLLAALPFTLMRTAGVSGMGAEFHWRWTPTPEERLLAQTSEEPNPVPQEPEPSPTEAPTEPPASKPAETPIAPSASAVPPDDGNPAAPIDIPAEWPGFRGPNRDSVVHTAGISTNWSASPPVQMWRRPIGPGWSSFAVRGDFLYTQEQRGDDEIVACYRVSTGEPVWQHRDAVRFWESNAGPGPRGTPTISGGRVYTFGATGILNALNARTGKRLWSRNVGTDTGVEVPDWGFASSPLVVDDIVVIAASGRLAAYDARTGNQRWSGPAGGGGYSSPHLLTIDGIPQILLLRGSRTISVSPADGKLLWEHVGEAGVSIVQPAVAPNGDVLIATGDMMGGTGIRRLGVSKTSAGWTVEERWSSRGLKPYFNDYVVHKEHAFGFDGSILSCIDLKDGARKWKGGRYGQGQLVLLSEQDVLLVLSEEGELALVGATSDQFRELARMPAVEGKTWNHPVLVRDVLLVRNGEEMAAFRLAPAAGRREATSQP